MSSSSSQPPAASNGENSEAISHSAHVWEWFVRRSTGMKMLPHFTNAQLQTLSSDTAGLQKLGEFLGIFNCHWKRWNNYAVLF